MDQDLDGEAANWRPPGARLKLDRRAMAGGRIEGAGLRGVMRLTWVEDHLAHVLDHCGTDEPAGAWTGLACQDHGLALGGDVDDATLRRLSAHGAIADLIWEPRPELAAEHGQLLQAAIQAAQDGTPDRREQLWQQVQAIWSLAWSANYAALKFVQDAGQAPALGGRLLRPPPRPAWPSASPRPQHRHHHPDDRSLLKRPGHRAGVAAGRHRNNGPVPPGQSEQPARCAGGSGAGRSRRADRGCRRPAAGQGNTGRRQRRRCPVSYRALAGPAEDREGQPSQAEIQAIPAVLTGCALKHEPRAAPVRCRDPPPAWHRGMRRPRRRPVRRAAAPPRHARPGEAGRSPQGSFR
jgi:hypothetical protein